MTDPMGGANVLPDCMMGPSEPCAGFQELQRGNGSLLREIACLRAALERLHELYADEPRSSVRIITEAVLAGHPLPSF